MIPSLVEQVIAARIPTARELATTQSRAARLDHVIELMRAHGNVTPYAVADLTGSPERVSRDWLQELERQGRVYSWKPRGSARRTWGLK